MAGEIMTAYIALMPSMKGFGSAAVRQIGPQAQMVGARAGREAGVAFTAAASKESENWLAQTAKGAIKNVTLYGSMYAAITSVQRGISTALDAMIGFNAEIEQATIGFETLLGSSSAARDQMQWIQDFAKETPFQYDDLVGYSQQLLALGFSAEQAREVLQATGDAAAALGRGPESIARINLALGQMWTKGKVQSQEMLQLTEAGIGAWQILADAYGATVEEIQDAVTAGLIKATDAVPVLIEGMNTRFGGLMEKQSQTYAGIVSNIQDTLKQQLAESGEPLFRELTVQAQRFLDALDDPEVLDTMRDLGGMLADGAGLLADAGELAWKFRDALLAVGIAVALSKLLSRVPVDSLLSGSTWTRALAPMMAYKAGVESLSGAVGSMLRPLRGGLQIAGIAGVVDGYRRVSEAAAEGEMSAIGFAEGIGAGALVGATFGSVILPGVGTAAGAAAGAVVGLATSVWSYQSAIDAANKDTTLAQQAFRDLGVDAQIASLAMQGITNEQLAAAGGIGALTDAMRRGDLAGFVADLEKLAEGLNAQADAMVEAADSLGDVDVDAAQALYDRAAALSDMVEVLTSNWGVLEDAQEQVVATAYQNAFAMDMQTGALGSLTKAAWDAVIAEGGLGAEALNAAARMEGLAGIAGYATQMISGIPVGTQINFSTNAAEITNQIAALIVAREAASNPNLIAAMSGRIKDLQSKLSSALTAPVTTLSLPTVPKDVGGRSAAAKRIADEAARAAAEAARKLEQDRHAQLRFGDAFTSLIASALEGNFEQYRDRLEDQITSLARGGYKVAADMLRKQSEALTQAALDYAALTNKLNVATDAYDDLTGRMRDQYNASRDLILGLGKATDAQSFDQLAYLLSETTARATGYQSVLQALKDQGLSDELWNQLAQAGPESMALAQSILAQGQAGIDQLNSLSGGLLDAADSMGSLVADSMYKQGLAALDAYRQGLIDGQLALDLQLETIANNVLNKTAGAITPGNAGYAPISTAPQQVANTFNVSVEAKSLGDLKTVQEFIAMLNQAPTTQLVNQAGTVVS